MAAEGHEAAASAADPESWADSTVQRLTAEMAGC